MWRRLTCFSLVECSYRTTSHLQAPSRLSKEWWNKKLNGTMKILLSSTYELGRQPFGLVSPAAWLRRRGHAVTCFDLTRQGLDSGAVREAELIAIYLPMHTATRLACKLIPSLREQNPGAHVCCYGLYAPMNAEYLRSLGVGTVLGGEFEGELVRLVERLGAERLRNGE